MNIKFTPNLFLETLELERFKESLDQDGFRKLLLQNSSSFGFIKNFKEDTQFDNCKVIKDVGQGPTYIKVKEGVGVDQFGNIFYTPETSLQIPNNNKWHWVKISHQYTNEEKGTFSISPNGDLVGVNSELLKILRGQPNFPTRVKFVNSSNNTLEYDVMEVSNDTHAILTHPALSGGISQFVSESDLRIKIVGTFTPGVIVPSPDKYPFEYDYRELELVEENIGTPNVRPSYVTDSEFYIARCKIITGQVVIQDKRIDYYSTKTGFQIEEVSTAPNPLIGVEQINWDTIVTDGGKNIVQLSWSFRSNNYTVDTSSNTLTLLSGLGGIFKSNGDFTDGDFDGWRIYTNNGNYAIVLSSIKQGGAINLVLDILDVDNYSSDGGTTFYTSYVNVTPNCEFIEIKALPKTADKFPQLEVVKIYPINLLFIKEYLTIYSSSISTYIVSYRYKSSLLQYSDFKLIPNNTVSGNGYLRETSFEENGDLKVVLVKKNYTDGEIELLTSINNISVFKSIVYLGDLLGVDHKTISNSNTLYDLVIGQDRVVQLMHCTGLVVANDIFINLNKTRVSATPAVNGNKFLLQLDGNINLNGRKIRIVTDYVNPGSYTLIRELSQADVDFINANPWTTGTGKSGLTYLMNYDGTDWCWNNSNEDYLASITAINLSLVTLSNGLATEITNRTNADTALQADINTRAKTDASNITKSVWISALNVREIFSNFWINMGDVVDTSTSIGITKSCGGVNVTACTKIYNGGTTDVGYKVDFSSPFPTANYIVYLSPVSLSANGDTDNDVIYTIRDRTVNSFEIWCREVAGNVQSVMLLGHVIKEYN